MANNKKAKQIQSHNKKNNIDVALQPTKRHKDIKTK